MRKCECRWSVCALVAVALFGCGKGEFATAPVSGKVTLDGQPLADAAVAFEPAEAPPSGEGLLIGSTGTTDSQGQFTLTTADGRPGAIVGKHKVSVTTRKADANSDSGTAKPLSPERVPAKYNAKTELTFDVPSGGSTAANFDLTGGKK